MSRGLVKVSLTREQAQALHWLARHLCFQDALDSTPPHIGKEARDEKAYGIIHAASALQTEIENADVRGDAWMYS